MSKRKCLFEGLSNHLCSIISKYGYMNPTPVQRKVIPLIRKGNSAIVIAPTGSGKTEAVLFPLFDLMLHHTIHDGLRETPMLVYITPLRALNRDIMFRMEQISSELGLKGIVKHGDSSQIERREFVTKPPFWFVTTPESFILMLSNETIRRLLTNLMFVVVDELHEVIDNKRGAALSLALARLSKLIKRRILYVGLTATVASDDVRFFIDFFPEKDLIVVRDDSSRKLKTEVKIPVLTRESVNEESWIDWVTTEIDRILEHHKNAIIFTNTRDLSELLGNVYNKKYGNKKPVMVHHGSLSRKIRQEVESRLKKGELKAVIATSSLELGIDVGTVDVVIQIGSPRQVTRLVQRAGRSGHRFGAESKAIILAEPSLDDVFESITIARRAIRGKLEHITFPSKPLDVLLHALVGEAIASTSVNLNEFAETAKRVLYFKDITLEDIKKIVEHAESIGILRKEGETTVRESRRSRSYYFKTTMITESKRVKVESVVGETIGYLDEEFVVSRLTEGDTFILAGKVWKVIGIDRDKLVVEAANVHALPPKWEGELIPVSLEVARETCTSLYIAMKNQALEEMKGINIEDSSRLVPLLREIVRNPGALPNPSYLLIETNSEGNIVVLYTCMGTRANDALSNLLSYVLFKMRGIRTASSSDPYRIVLYSVSRQLKKDVGEILEYLVSLEEEKLRKLIVESIRNSQLFDYTLFQVAKRMGAYTEETPLNLIKKSIRYLKDTIMGEEALNEIINLKIDVEEVVRMLKRLKTGKIKVNNNISKVTLLSRSFKKGLYPSLIQQGNITETFMLDVFEKKLQAKEVTIFCINCGYTITKRINELDEKPVCPKCGSRALAPLSKNEREEYLSILKNLVKDPKSRKNRKEKTMVKELGKRANLVLTYGKPAIIALSTYGVGPKNAIHALSRLKLGWREFLAELYRKELEYIRNRRYWED